MTIAPNLSAEEYLEHAFVAAELAAALGEVPIGATLVMPDGLIFTAGNRTILQHDACAHAEILAIRAATEHYRNHRLLGAHLYVTLEPCAMCAGAIIQARIPKLTYAADDKRSGAVKSIAQLLSHPELNHRVQVSSGQFASRSISLLQNFFQSRR